MIRLAAELADEVVLNLASPQRVAEVRQQVDDRAAAADRAAPHLTVWVPVALRPGAASMRQAANQLAIYLAPPGYGEMFSELGFPELVGRARSGARRSELADAIPFELAEQVGAFGGPEQIAARLRAYLDAGADTVAVVPVTAEDPAGRATLECAAESGRLTAPEKEGMS
jgi:alkanesulfonate monooxygenase SsuD/methylene tetrahydromethanopterin reductase-like flavin-dependent oxidoreductase (luciferase family)